ncbi:hypothetical protein [Streptomyces sp. NPDC002855]|uniref:hypothetical protein n=1 Tax=Streptomyces sp. NPDC002855 TaxID=3154437 RepID=UPI00331D92DB
MPVWSTGARNGPPYFPFTQLPQPAKESIMQCTSCATPLDKECELKSALMVEMTSPIMPEDVGRFLLCFKCACKVNELITPQLLDEPLYIHNKDQVLAHRCGT